MSERLARLTPDALNPEQFALHQAIAGGARATGPQVFALAADDGSLNGPFGLMLHAPLLGHPLQELGAAVRYRTELTDRAREVAILVVAALTDSSFEWYAHERVGRAVGLDDTDLAAIRDGSFVALAGVDRVEATVDRVARELTAGGSLDDASYAAARTVLGEQGLMEVVVLVGYYRLLAQMMAVFGVEAPEEAR